jgi:hypothetical protein
VLPAVRKLSSPRQACCRWSWRSSSIIQVQQDDLMSLLSERGNGATTSMFRIPWMAARNYI